MFQSEKLDSEKVSRKDSEVPCKPSESRSILKKENFSNVFHPDDLLPLYQNKGLGLKVPAYNLDVKQKARSQNTERLQKSSKNLIRSNCTTFWPLSLIFFPST